MGDELLDRLYAALTEAHRAAYELRARESASEAQGVTGPGNWRAAEQALTHIEGAILRVDSMGRQFS